MVACCYNFQDSQRLRGSKSETKNHYSDDWLNNDSLCRKEAGGFKRGWRGGGPAGWWHHHEHHFWAELILLHVYQSLCFVIIWLCWASCFSLWVWMLSWFVIVWCFNVCLQWLWMLNEYCECNSVTHVTLYIRNKCLLIVNKTLLSI